MRGDSSFISVRSPRSPHGVSPCTAYAITRWIDASSTRPSPTMTIGFAPKKAISVGGSVFQGRIPRTTR